MYVPVVNPEDSEINCLTMPPMQTVMSGEHFSHTRGLLGHLPGEIPEKGRGLVSDPWNGNQPYKNLTSNNALDQGVRYF